MDLDSQVNTLFTKSQLIMKPAKQWLSAGKSRRESQLQISRDYRSIIEGLQVSGRAGARGAVGRGLGGGVN